MGIVNVTPDSFAVACRTMGEDEVEEAIQRAVRDGARILDIGGCSTRPGAQPAEEEEEWRRVEIGLKVAQRIAPELMVSVDTFRPEVARRAIDHYHADIINDVSGGNEEMFQLIAERNTPYILTHARDTSHCLSEEALWYDVLLFFEERIRRLRELGLENVIVDPGFGFGKTPAQNLALLREMHRLKTLHCPTLAGISRKRMVFQTLGITPGEALNGTTALNMAALIEGANILRVHDVREAKQTIELYTTLYGTDRH